MLLCLLVVNGVQLSLFSPTDLTLWSLGLSAHIPFITDVVDFEQLQHIESELYINTYNLTEQQMECIPKKDITVDCFHASLAFPLYLSAETVKRQLLYSNYYIEGAAIDPLNYEALVTNHPEVETIVVFDILGCEKLFRQPRNLYDAWVMSIITPLVKIARDQTELFEKKYNIGPDGKPVRNVLRMNLDLPDEQYPTALDWSYSNLCTLFDIGYQAGLSFCAENNAALENAW